MYTRKQRWNLRKPNWELYSDLLEVKKRKIYDQNIIDIEKITQIFTDLITDTAQKKKNRHNK